MALFLDITADDFTVCAIYKCSNFKNCHFWLLLLGGVSLIAENVSKATVILKVRIHS